MPPAPEDRPSFSSPSLLQEPLLQADLHPCPGPDHSLKSPDEVTILQKILTVANVGGDVLQELSITGYFAVEVLRLLLPFHCLSTQVIFEFSISASPGAADWRGLFCLFLIPSRASFFHIHFLRPLYVRCPQLLLAIVLVVIGFGDFGHLVLIDLYIDHGLDLVAFCT